MARRKSSHLTDAELRLMEVLWEKGAAPVSEVVDAVAGEAPLAYSTGADDSADTRKRGLSFGTKKEGRALSTGP